MADKLFIGFDVSKDWIDVARHGGAGVDRIANEAGSTRRSIGRGRARKDGCAVQNRA